MGRPARPPTRERAPNIRALDKSHVRVYTSAIMVYRKIPGKYMPHEKPNRNRLIRTARRDNPDWTLADIGALFPNGVKPLSRQRVWQIIKSAP